MKIGIYNLEPQIINSALMKISFYHKKIGDQVEKYSPIFHNDYDKIYCSSIFNFSDKSYVKSDMICGGTGFDISSRLPQEIEECEYDWSLYPDCDYSIVWFSTGCIRNCPFCVVRKKEGYIKPAKARNLNPNGTYIKVMNNNFFANPEWRSAVKQLKEWNQKIDFQGVDVRILDKEQCESLNSLKLKKQIKIAWDLPQLDLLPKLKEIVQYIKPYKLMCYVLIGYNSTPEQDLYRIEELRKLKIDPFIAPFNKFDEYQNNLARYVNFKAIFKSIKWEDYKKIQVDTNNKKLEQWLNPTS